MTKRVFHFIVDVNKGDIPFKTAVGIVWTLPISHSHDSMSCEPDKCPYYEKCRVQVCKGNFVACEQPLQKELIPKNSRREEDEILVAEKRNSTL